LHLTALSIVATMAAALILTMAYGSLYLQNRERPGKVLALRGLPAGPGRVRPGHGRYRRERVRGLQRHAAE
ncbi:hypothetical protein ACP3TI_02625, partial [Desulforudis sp. 1190]|uniref:hypothetical protein n=1 Tax=Desulforudis sp. 1190 TaxID=3416136 RepID=UPI003CF65B6E